MKRLTFIALILTILLASSACSLGGSSSPTGDSASDPASAERFLPTLVGYTSHNVDSITSAITAAGGTAALFTGNVLVAGAITQIDSMISCYRSVGAVAARVYTENNIAQLLGGQVPKVGALAIINQDRLANNFLSCATGGGAGGETRSQDASVQPCAGSGTFTSGGETLHYLYAASNPELCSAFVRGLPSS
ncbi:MAG: hypothetical protein SGI73_19685 [Chloroflexota bacterium]|nr:hypothetical protein [Chloroflexota bacterium]